MAVGDILPQEIDLFQRFQMIDAPQEVFALEEESRGHGLVKFVEIILRGGDAELRLYPDDSKLRYFHRKLTGEEVEELRSFIAQKSVDRLKDYAAGVSMESDTRTITSPRTAAIG